MNDVHIDCGYFRPGHSDGRTYDFEAVVPRDWQDRWPCGALETDDVVAAQFVAGDLVDVSIYRDGAAVELGDLMAAELDAVLESEGRAVEYVTDAELRQWALDHDIASNDPADVLAAISPDEIVGEVNGFGRYFARIGQRIWTVDSQGNRDALELPTIEAARRYIRQWEVAFEDFATAEAV